MRKSHALMLSLLWIVPATLQAGTNLSKAAISGDVDRLKACLAKGEKLDDYDKWGWTPLFWAVFYQQEIAAKWLLSQGANPNVQSNQPYRDFPSGTTALGLAAYYGQDQMVSMLIGMKANPDLADSKGKKPTDYAKQFGFETIVSNLRQPRQEIGRSQIRVNPLIEKISDFAIVISSTEKNPDFYLENLSTAIKTELANRKIRNLVHVSNRVDPKDGEILAARLAEFKPKFILHIKETECRDYEGQRITSVLNLRLSIPEKQEALLETEATVRDSGSTIMTFRHNTANNAINMILWNLEAEKLL